MGTGEFRTQTCEENFPKNDKMIALKTPNFLIWVYLEIINNG